MNIPIYSHFLSIHPKYNLKMNFHSLFIIFVILVAILSHIGVKATGLLCEDFGSANHLQRYPSLCVLLRRPSLFVLSRQQPIAATAVTCVGTHSTI